METAAREIALWVCQRDDNRTEHDAIKYEEIIRRNAEQASSDPFSSTNLNNAPHLDT